MFICLCSRGRTTKEEVMGCRERHTRCGEEIFEDKKMDGCVEKPFTLA